MAAVRLALLGGFALTGEGGAELALTTRKDRLLLAFLALSAGKPQSRDKLAGLLWGDRGETQARDSLRQSLAAIRQAFRPTGLDPVKADRETVAFDPSGIEIDVLRFEATPSAAFYRGDLLEGIEGTPEYEQWLTPERERLAGLAVRALEQVSIAGLAECATDEAVALGRRLLAADRLREPVYRALMRLHARRGERTEALKIYAACREALQQELKIDPDLKTQNLYRDILTDQPETPAPTAPSTPTTPESDISDRPSIAVLPFSNLSNDPQMSHLCEGIAEDIVTGLGRFRLLFVIDRYSSSAVARTTDDVAEIGKRLGVSYVVQGSLQRQTDRLRITVRLVNATTRAQIWAEAFDCPMSEAPGISDRLTGVIVSMLHTRVESSLVEQSRRKPKLAAYECLLRGVKHLRGYAPGDNEKAIELFQQAVDLDPDYALAIAYRGFGEIVRHGYDEASPEIVAYARSMTLKAVEMDPEDGRCHWLFGLVLGACGDWVAEEREYQRALALNPNDANAIALSGVSLASRGQYDEGIARMREAMRLNPYHPEWYWVDLGSIFYTARRYADAVEAFSHRTEPGYWVMARLAAAYAQLGRMEEARTAAAEVLRLRPTFSLAKLRSGGWIPEDARHFTEGMRKAGLPE